VPTELIAKAVDGVLFEILGVDEVGVLEKALSLHDDRGPYFYQLLTGFSYYERVKWDYADLSKVIVVPYFGCKSFEEFEKDPHPSIREKLDNIPPGSFHQDEPIIVVPFQGQHMLLEGTLRSLWFARDRNSSTKLEVWVPTVLAEQ